MSRNDLKIHGRDIREAGITDGLVMGDALSCPCAVKALGRDSRRA